MWFAIASQHLSVLVSVLAVPTKTCLESRIKKSKPISGLKWAGNGTWVPGYGLDDCTGLKGDETVGPLSEQIRQFVPRLDLSCMVSECPFTGQTHLLVWHHHWNVASRCVLTKWCGPHARPLACVGTHVPVGCGRRSACRCARVCRGHRHLLTASCTPLQFRVVVTHRHADGAAG